MHQISLTASFNVLFRVCVCVQVVVHGNMRGTALHLLVYCSLLNIYHCRWAPCCMGKWNAKVRWSFAKTKPKALGFFFPSPEIIILSVSITAESKIYALKKIAEVQKGRERNVQLDWVLLGFSEHTGTQWRTEMKQRQWWVLAHRRRVWGCLADSWVSGLLPRMKTDNSLLISTAQRKQLNNHLCDSFTAWLFNPLSFHGRFFCWLQCCMELTPGGVMGQASSLLHISVAQEPFLLSLAGC